MDSSKASQGVMYIRQAMDEYRFNDVASESGRLVRHEFCDYIWSVQRNFVQQHESTGTTGSEAYIVQCDCKSDASDYAILRRTGSVCPTRMAL